MRATAGLAQPAQREIAPVVGPSCVTGLVTSVTFSCRHPFSAIPGRFQGRPLTPDPHDNPLQKVLKYHRSRSYCSGSFSLLPNSKHPFVINRRSSLQSHSWIYCLFENSHNAPFLPPTSHSRQPKNARRTTETATSRSTLEPITFSITQRNPTPPRREERRRDSKHVRPSQEGTRRDQDCVPQGAVQARVGSLLCEPFPKWLPGGLSAWQPLRLRGRVWQRLGERRHHDDEHQLDFWRRRRCWE